MRQRDLASDFGCIVMLLIPVILFIAIVFWVVTFLK
jgi:hypothetical protein